MKIPKTIIALSILTAFVTLPLLAKAQTLDFAGETTAAPSTVLSGQTYLNYTQPTQKAMAENYALDAFGPYAIVAWR